MSLWWAHFSFLNPFSGETLTCVLQLLNGGISHRSPLPRSKLGAEASEGRRAGELSTGRAVASEVHPLTLQFLLSVLRPFLIYIGSLETLFIFFFSFFGHTIKCIRAKWLFRELLTIPLGSYTKIKLQTWKEP